MDFRPLARAPEAFQESVTADQVVAMCRRAFGDVVRVTSATIYRAVQRQGAERDAFFASYGPLPSSAGDELRARFYLARHLVGIRLERHRLAEGGLADTYDEVRAVLAELG